MSSVISHIHEVSAGIDCGGENIRPAGALFPPANVQICLPNAPCRLSPPAIALQVLQEPYHFRSFGSAHCLLAGKPSGVPDTVGYDYWHITVSFNLFTECSAVSVAAFSQFYALWQPLLRPGRKGTGKIKRLVTKTTSFEVAQRGLTAV